MKLIVLATLVALVSSDRLEGETRKLSQAIEYGLPFNVEVAPNRFTTDSKIENKATKVTEVSSSSTSHTLEEKTTGSSDSRFGSRPDGETLQDLPNKKVTSFISDNTASAKISDRTESGENKNEVKTFELGATIDRSSDGSQKPELSTKISDGDSNQRTSADEQIIQSKDQIEESDKRGPLREEQKIKSTFRLDTLERASPGLNDGSDKRGPFRDEQRIKSTLRSDTLDSASHYDDGSYKPELYEITDHNVDCPPGVIDGINTQDALRDGQRIISNLRLDTFDSVSHYDDGSYKPELYKIVDHQLHESGAPGIIVGPNTQDALRDDLRVKSNLRLDTFGGALHYDDGSYKPELYKIVDHQLHESGAPGIIVAPKTQDALRDDLRIKSNLRLDTFDSASHFDDGSYRPELYKIVDQNLHESGAPGIIVGPNTQDALLDDLRVKSNLRLDTFGGALHYGDGSYKPELYKIVDHRLLESGAPGIIVGPKPQDALRDDLRIKSNLRLDTFDSASHFDDGSYKPELYEITDHNVNCPPGFIGGPVTQDALRDDLRIKSNLRLDTFGGALHYDDGSYRPELYKIVDHQLHESGAPGIIVGPNTQDALRDDLRIKSNLRLDTFDSASHFDDGSYKPELYKIVDQRLHESGAPGIIVGPNTQDALNDDLRVKSNLRLDTFGGALHYGDGSYKPELYKIVDHRLLESGAPGIIVGPNTQDALRADLRIKSNLRLDTFDSASHFDDGSYKPELYEITDHNVNCPPGFIGGPVTQDALRDDLRIKSNLRLDTFGGALHYDDGSYRPELYKIVDHQLHESGAPGIIVGPNTQDALRDDLRVKSNLRLDTFGGALHYDDGSYRPELYKIIDRKLDESGTELRRTEDSQGKLDVKSNLKLHSEYGVPAIYTTSFTDNVPFGSFEAQLYKTSELETGKIDDGSYKPELYERIDQLKADRNGQIIKTAQHDDEKHDGSFKQETSHKSFSSSSHKESSSSSTATRFEAEQRREGLSGLKQDFKLKKENNAPEVYKTGFTAKDGTNVEEHGRLIHTNVKGWEDVVQRTGHYEYISPEGKPIRVDWIADHNGFRAKQS